MRSNIMIKISYRNAALGGEVSGPFDPPRFLHRVREVVAIEDSSVDIHYSESSRREKGLRVLIKA